jgi:REP element-mobilizing transposase RayT
MVTTSVAGRAPFLADPLAARIVVEALQWLRKDRRILLHGYSVMPDHLHLVLTVLEPYTISQVMHSLKSFTANRINERLKRSGAFWNDGFQEEGIGDKRGMRACLAYLMENPRRAGLVTEGRPHHYTRVFQELEGDLDPW